MALLLVLKLLAFNLLMVEEISSICPTLDLFFRNQDFFWKERKWMGEGKKEMMGRGLGGAMCPLT
jgi:hypothetical protein